MRLKSRYLVAATVGFLTACAHDVTGPERLQGAYQLNRVNGALLPVVAESVDSSRLEMIGGSLSLDPNGTWVGEVTMLQTVGTGVTTATRQANGTFSVDGDRLTFTELTGESYSGVLSGNRLTAEYEGITFEFVKQ